MRIKPEQITTHLQKNVLPVYLLSGDEPLLLQELADQIRHTCRQLHFSEREVFHADKGFNWDNLLASAAEMSLFGDKKILELRLGDKVDAAASQALQQYCEQANPDNVLIITVGKLDKKTLETKWAKAIDHLGAIIQVWPVEPAHMPRWLDDRLKKAGLQANQETLLLLADRTQGNLLAAAQEVERLKLFCQSHIITSDIVSQVVAHSARYDLFNSIDDMIGGKIEQALTALRGLRGEGTEASVILWALAKEIRTLARLAENIDQGTSLDAALTQARVWDKRKGLYQSILKGRRFRFFQFLLSQTSQVDRQIKGMEPGNPWDSLEKVCLMFKR